MKEFEARPVHVKWGIGILMAFLVVCIFVRLFVGDFRLRLTMWIGFGIGMFTTWFLIRQSHRNIVYQVDAQGLRYLRGGKMVREIPRKRISTIRLSRNRVYLGVKDLGNFTLTPVEGAREIYQLLSH